jgi:hypothetical protein
MFWGSGGSKNIRPLKRRVQSHLGRREVKNCTPLRRNVRTKRNQNVQSNTKRLNVGTLLEVKMSKKCTRLWREAHSK